MTFIRPEFLLLKFPVISLNVRCRTSKFQVRYNEKQRYLTGDTADNYLV